MGVSDIRLDIRPVFVDERLRHSSLRHSSDIRPEILEVRLDPEEASIYAQVVVSRVEAQ